MKKNEFAFFNILRFIGAISIAIFLHYYDHFLLNMDRDLWFKDYSIAKNLSQYSYVFVEMFFMISGILFSFVYKKKIEEGEKFDKFIIARYKRIFPLVIISSIFMYITNAIYFKKFKMFYSCGSLSMLELIYDVLFSGTIILGTGITPLNGPLWYIGPLMICYVIAYILTKLYIKYKSKLIFFIPVFIGSAILLCNYNCFILNKYVARGLIAFFMGMIIFSDNILNRINELNNNYKKILKSCLIIIIVIGIYSTVSKHNDLLASSKYNKMTEYPNNMINYYNNLFIYIYLVFIPLFYLLYDVKWINKICDTKFCRYLGNISYSIYIWNFPILITITYILKSNWITINIQSWKFIFANFVIHIVVATLSYYLIENNIKQIIKRKEQNLKNSCNE